MIEDLDSTLKRLLQEKVSLPPDQYDIVFDRPDSDRTAAFAADRVTLNLFLYDIRENRELRRVEWKQEVQPDGTFVKLRPPVRIDCSYLITAWSPANPVNQPGVATQEEHTLLAQVLTVLLRYATIPPEVLQGRLVGQQPPLPTMVAHSDGVRDPAEFWSALDNLLRPSLNLVVTISIDPSAYLEAPERLVPVVSKTLEFGAGIERVYRIHTRPLLRKNHKAGETVRAADVARTVAARLGMAVFASARSITVVEGQDLRANEWVVVDDGDDSDFMWLSLAPGAGAVEIPAQPPLRFAHAAGVSVRHITVALTAVTTLREVADQGADSIRVANGKDLSDGHWLMIDDAERTEFLRLAGPGVTGPVTLPLRHPLRFAHDAGRGLRQVKVTVDTAATQLQQPANQPTATITLDSRDPLDTEALVQDMVVMVGTGAETEFCRLGVIPAAPSTTVPVSPPLQNNHAAVTPLREITDGAVVGRLSRHAATQATEVLVVGKEAANLHAGDVIRLAGAAPTAYHQITAVSSETGAGSGPTEVLVQIGGQVTDNATLPSPIAGARVALVELHLVATSDAAGRFIFSNLNAGDYTLRVTATGYSQQDKPVRVPARTVDEYHVRLNVA